MELDLITNIQPPFRPKRSAAHRTGTALELKSLSSMLKPSPIRLFSA
jgi:hypothetical protein